jgi:16S rRNA C1402 (ribose-2'-O) methylase RsmI
MKPGMTLIKLEPVNNLLYQPVTVGSSAVIAMLSVRWMPATAAVFLGFLDLLVFMRAAHM